MDRFSRKKLNEVEGKEQYRVGLSNRLSDLQNLDTETDINRCWETNREKYKFQPKRV
jgi:hypothetical protein